MNSRTLSKILLACGPFEHKKCFECGDEWDEQFMTKIDTLEEVFLCTSCFEREEKKGDKEKRQLNIDYIQGAL